MKDKDYEGQNLGIQEVIIRAIQDEAFRKELVNDADKALSDYDLSEIQRVLIKSLDEEDLGKLTEENMEEYFAADSAVYTPDVEYDEIEEASEEDL